MEGASQDVMTTLTLNFLAWVRVTMFCPFRLRQQDNKKKRKRKEKRVTKGNENVTPGFIPYYTVWDHQSTVAHVRLADYCTTL